VKVWTADRSLRAIFATAIIAAIMVSFLPEDPGLRFQQLDNTEYRNLRWIYERTHLDPRAIDVAILGSSRIETGVDARRLEASFRAAGVPVNVENFGIPYNGRDLDLTIARELLATKRPRVLVIGVPERPSQRTHVTYKYVASSRDIVGSVVRGNIDYLADLAYLPYRHMKIFWSGLTHQPADPVKAGNEMHFDPGMTYNREPGGRWRVDYPQRGTGDIVAGARRSLTQGSAGALAKVEPIAAISAERRNITAIAALAKARGTAVVFLFIPQFMSDGELAERAFYRRQGPLLDASFVATHVDLYSSWGHLNARGAAVVDDWLYRQLVDGGTLSSRPSRPSPMSGGERPRAR